VTELPVFRNYSEEISNKMTENEEFAKQILHYYTELADNENTEAQYASDLI